MRPAPTFEYCALHYANMWQRDERPFFIAFHEGDDNAKFTALTDAAKHFRIARNFPSKFLSKDIGHRNEVISRELATVNLDAVGETKLAETVEQVRERISKEFGNRQVLSATTKFLWLKFRSPVVIYDQQACEALGSRSHDYAEFVARWRDRFEADKPRIIAACETLPSLWKYCFDTSLDAREELAAISGEAWFHERVLDDCLWHEGAGKP